MRTEITDWKKRAFLRNYVAGGAWWALCSLMTIWNCSRRSIRRPLLDYVEYLARLVVTLFELSKNPKRDRVLKKTGSAKFNVLHPQRIIGRVRVHHRNTSPLPEKYTKQLKRISENCHQVFA